MIHVIMKNETTPYGTRTMPHLYMPVVSGEKTPLRTQAFCKNSSGQISPIFSATLRILFFLSTFLYIQTFGKCTRYLAWYPFDRIAIIGSAGVTRSAHLAEPRFGKSKEEIARPGIEDWRRKYIFLHHFTSVTEIGTFAQR